MRFSELRAFLVLSWILGTSLACGKTGALELRIVAPGAEACAACVEVSTVGRSGKREVVWVSSAADEVIPSEEIAFAYPMPTRSDTWQAAIFLTPEGTRRAIDFAEERVGNRDVLVSSNLKPLGLWNGAELSDLMIVGRFENAESVRRFASRLGVAFKEEPEELERFDGAAGQEALLQEADSLIREMDEALQEGQHLIDSN